MAENVEQTSAKIRNFIGAALIICGLCYFYYFEGVRVVLSWVGDPVKACVVGSEERTRSSSKSHLKHTYYVAIVEYNGKTYDAGKIGGQPGDSVSVYHVKGIPQVAAVNEKDFDYWLHLVFSFGVFIGCVIYGVLIIKGKVKLRSKK